MIKCGICGRKIRHNEPIIEICSDCNDSIINQLTEEKMETVYHKIEELMINVNYLSQRFGVKRYDSLYDITILSEIRDIALGDFKPKPKDNVIQTKIDI